MSFVCRRRRLGAPFVLRAAFTGLLAVLAVLAVGCGGKTQLNNGTPVLTVSATNTRFTSFVGNISSISLTRNDGNVFTVLSVGERADFTQVTDLTELLNAPALPEGTYSKGSITIDLSSPVINVDVNGQSVAATPVDTTGAVLTAVTLVFNLDPAKPLVVTRHESVRLGLDFDLAASTIINTAASPLTVTVTPFIVVSVVVPNSNPVRVHGAFLLANQADGTIALNSRPFNDQVDSLGAVTVVTNANTTYDLNGVVYTGTAGLAAVGKLPINSGIAAVGTFTDVSKVTPVLTATQVYAGNTLEGAGVDRVIGEIRSRVGNVITVHGASLLARSGALSFINDASLTVGDATIVNTDGSGATGQTISALSVGQRIQAIGQGTVDATTGAITIDATAGEVRLQPTRAWGTLKTAAPGSLAMNLLSIGPHEVSAFDFTGTGSTPAADASAANYVVNTGTTDESATPAVTLLRVDGLVNSFGSAPPAFNASAVTAAPAIQSVLQVEWLNGGAVAPFLSSNSSGLVIDLANANLGSVHEIDTGPSGLDLKILSASPLIVPDANGTNFSVGGGTGLVLNSFTTFSAFVTQLGTDLNGTTAMRKLVALGHYDDGTKTFTATRIDLVEQ